MNRAYRVALICGFLPLLVGVSIFLLWYITRWDRLMTAGVFSLYGGFAVIFIGAIALFRYSRIALRTPDLPRRRLWLSIFACAALLLSNFFAAGGIIVCVVAMRTRYTVTIRNTSERSLGDCRVFGGGCEADFGAIPPGGIVQRSFWIRHDGALEFHAVSGSATHSKIIDEYVANGTGGDTTVTIEPDGSISVSKKTPNKTPKS